MNERVLELPAFIASLAPRDVEDARRLLSATPPAATAVEWRLDLAEVPIAARALLALDSRPALVTYRSSREGGAFEGSTEEQEERLRQAYEAGATVDVEWSSGLLSDGRFSDRRRVVVSSHSPFGLPEGWEARLEAMLSAGGRAVKMVAGAPDLPGSLRIAAIQRRLSGAPVSVFPMGPASAAGRVLSALSGGCLVYGSVGRATAAGQLSLSELLDVYRVNKPRNVEALFGIVGRDVEESLSPLLHNSLFVSRGMPAVYLPLPIADFDRARPQELEFDPPFRGFSVTRPWKVRAAASAIPSEDVRATGAANTLLLARGRWRAENTDVDGIFDPLADHDTGEGRAAIVLGSGGTARAAVVAARRLGYEVLISSRRDASADTLSSELKVDSMAWADLAESEADLYVNATPVGGGEEEEPALPPRVLDGHPLVFDCVYRRDGRPTSTIRAARAAGCPTVDGIQMFAAQALRQARLFGVEDATLEEISRLLPGRAIEGAA